MQYGCNIEESKPSQPVPLHFANPPVDHISKNLTSFGNNPSQRIVYMGPRHTTQHKAYKCYGRPPGSQQPSYTDPSLYTEGALPCFEYEPQKEKFYPPRLSEYRLFMGMNPTVPKN